MRAADAAWLHMDRPTNPMVVNGLNLFESPLDPELSRDLLLRRLVARFPRFSQRVADPLGRSPVFEPDPSFDIDNHLHRLALPAPGGTAELLDLLGDLVTQPLDPGKPLWHAYSIEGYEGGTAVLWRIHHCIADGIALTKVLLSTTDESEANAEDEIGAGNGSRSGPIGALVGGATTVRDAAGSVVHHGIESALRPGHLRELADAAVADAGAAAKLIGASPDPPSGLRTQLTGRRRVAWSEPVGLDAVKEAAHRRSVTVNDLLLTALAAALREQLGAGGVPEAVHAMVPFNLRVDEPLAAELGNDFALVLLELPTGKMTPAERLRRVSSRMDEIKESSEAPVSYGIVSAIGLTPPWVEDRLIGFFSDKASLVVTNVPGPAERLHFAGVPLSSTMVWAPCSGSLGLTVSIFSYAGEVTSGFMADTALLADPAGLAADYSRELERLCA